MELGVVGKPNVGKSTFFSAVTLASAEIAGYPFTTIDANRGVGYARAKCPHEEIGRECNPNNAPCRDGTRFLPVEIIDVAGLVPDAHSGRGLGNKFLDDLRQANVLIHIVDASGSTDFEGNPCRIGEHDPVEDVNFLEREIVYWMKGLLGKDWHKIMKRSEMTGGKIEKALAEKFAGLGIGEKDISKAIRNADLPDKYTSWKDDELLRLCGEMRKISKPMIIAANKADIAPPDNIERLRKVSGVITVPTCAEYELALRRADKSGLISYMPGDRDFKILKEDKLTPAQKKALEKIHEYLEKNEHGTGVQKCIEEAVFNLLDLIVVYPVEDENKFSDKRGRVLPDAYLMRRGSTARDLAYKVHTEIGEGFIRAVNARTKRIIGADYTLEDGDIIKIISSS